MSISSIEAGDALRPRVRVLIVDDSMTMRRLLASMLSGDRAIEVIGAARDPLEAREKIKALNPDVLTLDIEMPGMDGLTFLRNLMRLRPMPVVMISSLTERGAAIALDAIEAGALDYLPKPVANAALLPDYREELIDKVKWAARVRPRVPRMRPRLPAPANLAGPVPERLRPPRATECIIAIGASTGGIEAIKEVLMGFSPDTPAVMIAQHIPKAFSASFARRMNACCRIAVHEAEHGQPVLAGNAYIAPGDRHLRLVRDGMRFVCSLDDSDPINRHRPSVDALFRSVALNAGGNAVGVLLTGMGHDGARGLKDMREAGAQTIAQDEATSVVWGMPREAIARSAAVQVLPLEHISSEVMRLAIEPGAASTGLCMREPACP